MEAQDILKLETGTKEVQSLSPKKVKIVKVTVETVIDKNGKTVGDKAVCEVKHPDKEETVSISSVEYRKGKEIKTSGLWVSLDEDGNIRKGSALATFKDFFNAKTLKELEGKEEIPTTEDDKGYLCFKAY